MKKLKNYEYQCKVCEKIYNKNGAYSPNFCHVICSNQDRKNKVKAKQEENNKKKQLQNSLNPKQCLYFNEFFSINAHIKKYCGEICQKNAARDKKNENKTDPKKKIAS